MLLFNALTSVVLTAARLDRPDLPGPRQPEPKPFRLAGNPVPPAIPAASPALSPVRLFGRLLVEE